MNSTNSTNIKLVIVIITILIIIIAVIIFTSIDKKEPFAPNEEVLNIDYNKVNDDFGISTKTMFGVYLDKCKIYLKGQQCEICRHNGVKLFEHSPNNSKITIAYALQEKNDLKTNVIEIETNSNNIGSFDMIKEFIKPEFYFSLKPTDKERINNFLYYTLANTKLQQVFNLCSSYLVLYIAIFTPYDKPNNDDFTDLPYGVFDFAQIKKKGMIRTKYLGDSFKKSSLILHRQDYIINMLNDRRLDSVVENILSIGSTGKELDTISQYDTNYTLTKFTPQYQSRSAKRFLKYNVLEGFDKQTEVEFNYINQRLFPL